MGRWIYIFFRNSNQLTPGSQIRLNNHWANSALKITPVKYSVHYRVLDLEGMPRGISSRAHHKIFYQHVNILVFLFFDNGRSYLLSLLGVDHSGLVWLDRYHTLTEHYPLESIH